MRNENAEETSTTLQKSKKNLKLGEKMGENPKFQQKKTDSQKGKTSYLEVGFTVFLIIALLFICKENNFFF